MTGWYKEDYKILHYAHCQSLFQQNTLPWFLTLINLWKETLRSRQGSIKDFSVQWGNGDVSDTKFITQAS